MVSSSPMKQISLDLNLITTTVRQPEFHAQMQRTTPRTALVVLIASLDDSTLLRFCHWLEKREWANHILAAARSRLTVQGLPPKSATTMDGSSIAATSPAGNTDKDRDPKMHSSPNGTRWCFRQDAVCAINAEDGAAHINAGTRMRVPDNKGQAGKNKSGPKGQNERETAMYRLYKAATCCLIRKTLAL